MANSPIGILAALGEGARRVGRAWRYLLMAQAFNIVLALTLAVFVQDAIRTSLGSSLAGERMKESWDSLWYGSFSAQASGVAATLRPTVSGAGAVLDVLDTFLDGFAPVFGDGPESSLWPLLLLYLFSWTFLSGGFVSLFVRPDRRVGFFSRAAHLFPPLLIVTLVGLAGYAAILGPLRSRADDFVAGRLRDVIDERVQFAWTLGEYALLWALVFFLSLLLDYAKVFVARDESERAAPLAALAGLRLALRFISSHALVTVSLYVLIGFLGLLGLALYVALVPGAADASVSAVMFTFLIGQAYLLGRIALRCLFFAGEAQLVLTRLPETTVPAP